MRARIGTFVLTVAMLAPPPATVGAEDEPTDQPVTAPGARGDARPAAAAAPAAARWQPTIPDEDGNDWLELVSGEWLRGKLERLRDETLEFDSEELDELTLDFEDVAGFRVGSARIFVLTDRTEHLGRAVMDKGRILVWTADGERAFAREQLLSIVPAGNRRIDRWDGKISVGVSSRSGNTDEQDMSAFGYLRRSTPLTRLRFDYNGDISIVSGNTNANSHRGTAKFDVFLSDRWYLSPAILEVFSDPFQNIALRITPSAAVGYHLTKRPKIDWDYELGAGAQLSRADTVPLDDDRNPLTDEESLVGALITSTRLEWEITSRIDWTFFYRLQLGVPEFDQRFQHLFTTLSVELTKAIDLDVSLTFDRSANPPPEADGTIPKENDVTIAFGFGLDF